jgi:hypothetical protein
MEATENNTYIATFCNRIFQKSKIAAVSALNINMTYFAC